MKKIEFDLSTFLPVLFLSLLSVALIYSAKHASLNSLERILFAKQALWVILGLIVFIFAYRISLRTHEILAYFYYALGVLTLLALYFLGSAKYGATRWFNLGPFSIQPSEIMKLAAIVALARFLAYPKKSSHDFLWVIITVLMAALPMLLVLRQPDLGTSLIFLALALSLLFWSGLSVYLIFLLVTPLLSLPLAFHWISWGIFFVGVLIAIFYIRPGKWLGIFIILLNLGAGIITPLLWNRLHDYQKDRILSFLDPRKDPRGAGYQLIQSKVAIGSGGVLGKGYLNSSQARLEFLPMQHTDFIYSVLGEEFGMGGCLLILSLMIFLFYKGVLTAQKARNSFASLLAWGITTVLAFQSFVNIGMTVGILPVTGIPLPFLSYGGSAMLVNWAMWGLLSNVNARWQEY